MKTYKVSGDLILEAHVGAGEDDKSLLVLRSRGAEANGEPQRVIIYSDEIRHLIAALAEAGGWLAEQTPRRQI